MARRLHLQTPLPPAIGRTAVAAALFGFLSCLAAVLAVAPTAPAAIALPIAFVAALWTLPLFSALIRGETWALQLLLAAVLFVTIGNFRSRAWADKSLDWQVLLKGLMWLTAGAVGAVHLPRTRSMLATPRVLAGALFITVLVISTLWSAAPGYTLMSAGAYACLFLFALTLTHRLDERELLLAVAVGLGAIVVPSLLLAPVANSLAGASPGSTGALDNRLAGISDHPIGLAETSALFILACGALLPKVTRRRWLLVAMIGAALAAIFLSQSRMPGIAMLAAIAIVTIYRRGAWSALLPVALLVGTAIALVVVSYGFDAFDPARRAAPSEPVRQRAGGRHPVRPPAGMGCGAGADRRLPDWFGSTADATGQVVLLPHFEVLVAGACPQPCSYSRCCMSESSAPCRWPSPYSARSAPSSARPICFATSSSSTP